MYKRNDTYQQFSLFDQINNLSAKQHKLLSQSVEHSFFLNIFSKIQEDDFKVLYSSKKSRPNVPVNQLVGALILKHLYNWTYDELFRNLNFNLLTRYAIGVRGVSDDIFTEASIFNFQNKIIDHFVRTGRDLLAEVFDNLTSVQLKEFGISSDIQRGDSFLIGSNIFDYTRLQLLIEVLIRLYRTIDDKDKKTYLSLSEKYTKQTAGQYIYRVTKEDLPKEITDLSRVYHKLYNALKHKYADVVVFKIFTRIYKEHFEVINTQVQVIPSNRLNSSILLSPDDDEATFRNKGTLGKKGYCGHISETANPNNPLNLITDCAIVPNNVDDAKILENRLPEMISKTPDLSEYHADGNYGSPAVDQIMEENNITQVQNAVRGRKAFAKMHIEKKAVKGYQVTCEYGQKVTAEKATKGRQAKRFKAVFDYHKCLKCPLSGICKAQVMGVKIGKPKRVWYFSEEKIRLHRRLQNINNIPEERRKLRANVEATVKEVKRGVKNGKVRLRGKHRISYYLCMTALAVNLTRIHNYQVKKGIDSFMQYFRIKLYEIKTTYLEQKIRITHKQVDMAA